ncbi:hypothetical protein UPYG_G00353630 [Umbra pygmaea]|uniref:Matrix-remodeling-associated protein 7 helical domain-containing protein n=1 Tax=Umbra pygmaea TaxID=75934 RepID=A0ABD0VVW8_UMBPY
MDFSFLFPAVIFTLLALLLMTALFNSNVTASSLGSAAFNSNQSLDGSFSQCRREEGNARLVKSGLLVNLTESKWTAGPTSVDEPGKVDTECLSVGKITDPVSGDIETVLQEKRKAAEVGTHAAHAEKECLTSNSASAPVDIPGTDVGDLHYPEKSLQCPFYYQQTGGTTKSAQDSTNIEEVDTDSGPLKYVPGMLRTSQMEKMMTKEELEEEQRVQREQLAAIFQLLKENQETFGDVSEGDVEEQLRLYNI